MVLQQKNNAALWGNARAGAVVTIQCSWSKEKFSGKADNNGHWKIKVATPAAGGPYTITISDGKPVTLSNVLIGEVWLCSGQSNMEMPMKGYRDQPILHSNDDIYNGSNALLRLYKVPRSAKATVQDTTKAAAWQETTPETVAEFSATAYYFGRMLSERLKIPIGLVHISYSGSSAEAWMSRETLASGFPEIALPVLADTTKTGNRTATALYNAMLKPFIGFTIKGCIWYQGESNYDRPDQYESLFPALVKEWRTEFDCGEFPFYYCQIAPYNYAQLPPYNAGGKYNSAYLRDAQRKALKKIPNSGMAVLMDIGEENNIHPANKEAGGKRLALLALAKTYEQKGFGYTSPSIDTLITANGAITIKFKDAPNGFTSYGKVLQQFEIAGADKFWRPAKAVISGGNIIVASPDVKAPVAVRYAFKDFVVGDLFTTEGFPVSSFRTDDW